MRPGAGSSRNGHDGSLAFWLRRIYLLPFMFSFGSAGASEAPVSSAPATDDEFIVTGSQPELHDWGTDKSWLALTVNLERRADAPAVAPTGCLGRAWPGHGQYPSRPRGSYSARLVPYRANQTMQAVMFIHHPPATGTLLNFAGSVDLVYAAERREIRLPLPLLPSGAERRADGFGFKFSDFRIVDVPRQGRRLELNWRVSAPPLSATEPELVGASLAELRLASAAGTRSEALRGSGGSDGHDALAYRIVYWLPAGPEPRELVVSYAPRWTVKTLRFVLPEVALPAAGQAPRGPRGPASCESQGFKLKLDQVRLTRRSDAPGELSYRLQVTPPPALPVAAISVWATVGAADTDLGENLHALGDDSRGETFGAGSEPLIGLNAPSPNADRLVRLAGSLRVLVAEAHAQAYFLLRSEDFLAPRSRHLGPVCLEQLNLTETGRVIVDWSADSARLPGGAWAQLAGFTVRAVAAGAQVRPEGPDADSVWRCRDTSFHGQTAFRWKVGRISALTFRYPSQGRIVEIPFVFENVGLPHRVGDYAYNEELF